MANTARLYRIEALIRARGHVSFATMLQELEVSPATLKRDLEYLRSRLGAPIEYDRDLNGYRFAAAGGGRAAARHELPGLWFDEAELYSLLMAWQLLGSLEGSGLVRRHLQPLLDRIEQMLGSGSGRSGAARAGRGAAGGTVSGQAGGRAGAAQLMKRVRIVSAQRRPVPSRWFERISAALLTRQRLQLRYLTRTRGERSEREVSPQRLVHYRHTWYLDAWCHRAQALRRFALDAIEHASVLPTRAQDLPLQQVAATMDAGYGIFGGRSGAASDDAPALQWAILCFDAAAAAWASREEWHPDQRGRWREDGRWELALPYQHDAELVMDVLRQGPQVEVLAPPTLREKVAAALAAAAARYGPAAGAC